MNIRMISLAALAAIVVTGLVLPDAAIAQWSGPNYSYNGTYPNYILSNSHVGDCTTSYGPSPNPFVKATAGGSGGSGSATVEIKFNATYSAAPGTPGKTVTTYGDYAGSKSGTGFAECGAVNDPDGYVFKNTTSNGNPISPSHNSVGSRTISAPQSTIPLRGYAHADCSAGSSASAQTDITITG